MKRSVVFTYLLNSILIAFVWSQLIVITVIGALPNREHLEPMIPAQQSLYEAAGAVDHRRP